MVMLHLSQFVNNVQSFLVKVLLSYIGPNFNFLSLLSFIFSLHLRYHYILVV